MNATPEQAARDLLERLEHPNAQILSSGDVVELANLIAENSQLRDEAARRPLPGSAPGISLADHFAGLALQSLISLKEMQSVDDDILAKAAYTLADAMLEERDRRER